MALSNKQVDKIVKERTYFEVGLDIETGDVVYIDGRYVEENEDKELVTLTDPVNDDKILFVKYNEDTDRRIRDFLPRVLNQRGITEPGDIDLSHAQVQAKIKALRQSAGRNKRTVTEEDQLKIVEMVRKAHRPQYMIALMQVILWAMVYDDMFDLASTSGKGVSLNVKFDFEISPEYWKLNNKVDKDELLYAATDTWKVEFKEYDKNNILEMMLAFATTLLEEYPNISENIAALQNNVVTAFTFAGGGAQFDDAGFLNAELDELLHRPVFKRNSAVKRENTSGRVQPNNDEIKPKRGGGTREVRVTETEQT